MSNVKTTISGQHINTVISNAAAVNSSSPEGSLVITAAQLLPLDKRYIYFTPPVVTQGDPSDFSGDESTCTAHGFTFSDPDCEANGTGHLQSYYYSSGDSITLRLADTAPENKVYTLKNQSDTQDFLIGQGAANYPEGILFSVPPGQTIEIQKVAVAWEQVFSTSPAGESSPGGLELGSTATTAHRGDHGAAAYSHATTPHTKAFVGLGSVDNTSDLNKPISNAQAAWNASQLLVNAAKANKAGDIFTGPIEGTDLHLSGQLTQEPQTLEPPGATVSIHFDQYSNATLKLTSGSGLLTATIDVPTGVTGGTLLVVQNVTIARDFAAVSTVPINWVGVQPDWDNLALGSKTAVGWHFDGTELYLSAAAQLAIGTTAGTAYDGAAGAALSASLGLLNTTVANLTTTVNGKITNGLQGFPLGTGVLSAFHTAGTNSKNSFAVQMGGTGTNAASIGVLLVAPDVSAFGLNTNSVSLTPTATTFSSIPAWRTGLNLGIPSLATNATTGFMYVSSCSGTPTGVPTAVAGMIPVVADSTNNKLHFYSNSAWREAGGSGGGGVTHDAVFTGTTAFRLLGGTAGTDEGQILHDGTRLLIESKDGPVRIRPAGMVNGNLLEVVSVSGGVCRIASAGSNRLVADAVLGATNSGSGWEVDGGGTFGPTNTAFSLRLGTSTTVPATATATGTAGMFRFDANFLYIATANNTWKRVAVATW